MYIAMEDRMKQGSTKLHMDLSDAVNILVHEGESITGGGAGALWHIFSREDTVRLGQILKAHPSYNGKGNPIHQQNIYLTASDLDDLRRKYGIVAFVIVQRRGQAVFIPVGCAHQVRGLSA